ncbi:MAG: type IV toxin-antitoxin system AbiEi family antitoxin domain-containing protein [Myxococcota bacterium]
MTRPTKKPRRSGPIEEPFKASQFIARNPVFRFDDFVEAHTASGRSRATSIALLRYHVEAGRIRSVRRGLYAANTHWVDPWVIGSRLTHDATIAFDGALSFHGLVGLGHHISYVTRERPTHFIFNEVVYLGVTGREMEEGVVTVERAGQELRVTTRERTMVDLLDRLDLAPKPVELWKLFEKAGALDVEQMVHYATRLHNRVTAARLGFFLLGLKGTTPADLRKLQRLRPRSPAYFERSSRRMGDPYLRDWNLVVPRPLYERSRERWTRRAAR